MNRDKKYLKQLVDSETDQTVDQMRSGLERLDQYYPIDTPNLEWFQQMVAAEKKNLRRKFVRDLAIFWLVAVVLLSVYLVIFNYLPVTYIVVIQAIVAVLPIIVLLKKGRKAGDETYEP